MENNNQNRPGDSSDNSADSKKPDPVKYNQSAKEIKEENEDTSANNYGTIGHIGGVDLDDSERLGDDEDED